MNGGHTSMSVIRKQEQWRIYKPRKDSSGAASRIEMKIITGEKAGKDGTMYPTREVQMFWVASPQTGFSSTGNASFSWSEPSDNKSITLKLGEHDLGELLAALTGKKGEAGQTGGKYSGIYHQNSKGSTTLQFKLVEGQGYTFRLAKKPKSGELQEVKHTIPFGEAEILRVLLESAVRQIYEW